MIYLNINNELPTDFRNYFFIFQLLHLIKLKHFWYFISFFLIPFFFIFFFLPTISVEIDAYRYTQI